MLRIALHRLLIASFLFSLVLLQGCTTDSKDPLIAEWYFTDDTFTSPSSPTEDKILRLYPQGIYALFGTFSYSIGKWRFNDKARYIYLHQDTGTLQEKDIYLKTEALPGKHLTAMLYFHTLGYTDGASRLCHLRSQQNTSASDPYSPEANRWRHPPAQPETETAIRQRVIAYLQFLKAVYSHAINNKMESMDEDWYPMPLQMQYGKGVRIAYSTELDGWYQCFYNYEQAVKGYQLISGQVYGLHVKGGVNKFERNLDCVEQLLKGM